MTHSRRQQVFNDQRFLTPSAILIQYVVLTMPGIALPFRTNRQMLLAIAFW
jgi:hypothetical protein